MATNTGYIDFNEAAAPATPAAAKSRIYVKADGLFYSKDDAGVETLMSSGSSGSVATDAIWDAKGDLAGGTGANTAARLAVGANDTILMADSAQATGLKWVASQTPSTQAFSDAAAEGTADTYARGDHKHAMPASPIGSIQTYTPSWTSDGSAPSAGNATLSGRYRLLDSSLMWINIRFIRGSTSTNGTGAYRFSLPAAYKALAAGDPQVVSARVLDNGTRHYSGTALIDPNIAYFVIVLADTAGTAVFSHTQPITLATGDEVNIEGIIEYEAV